MDMFPLQIHERPPILTEDLLYMSGGGEGREMGREGKGGKGRGRGVGER